jgi:hypothetical protein
MIDRIASMFIILLEYLNLMNKDVIITNTNGINVKIAGYM